MVVLRRCVPSHQDEILAFCADHPARTAYLGGWVTEGGLSRGRRLPLGWMLAEREEEQITGLALVTDVGIVLPALATEKAREMLIEWCAPTPDAVRVLVGQRDEVSFLWDILERRGARARLERDQLAYLVDLRSFRPPEQPLKLEVAQRIHALQVIEASAAMAREEAQDDPQKRNPRLFAERIVERLRRGRDFVYFEDRKLAFKANVATLSSIAGQVEGIYTVPEARGRDIGLRGTAAVTEWVLDRCQRAFLLVNEDNDGARRMYERLGYESVMESKTIFAHP